MERFNVKEEDLVYISRTFSFVGGGRDSIISYKLYKSALEINKGDSEYTSFGSISYSKAPLEICAPVKDFNTKGMELKDFKLSKIEIPDPVVLQPVNFKGEKYYLIVTAWGDEASDELVVNETLN